MRMEPVEYYRVLNLSRDATEEEIKKAYWRLAFQYHPDRNNMDVKAEEKFKEIGEAYAVIGDPEKRKLYDRFGYNNFENIYTSKNANGFRSGFTDNMRTNFSCGRGMGCRRRAKFYKGDKNVRNKS